MVISLSEETQRMVEEKLGAGGYGTADEVVRAALAALDELEVSALDEETLDGIDRAEEQVARGEVHDWADVRDKVRATLRGA